MTGISRAHDVPATAPAGMLPVTTGKFSPDWESLRQYQTPDWFRDAKFGIWAHWTAQCVPEQGDWYARNMYIQGSRDYEYQVAHYGHPSVFGFKDIDNLWHAENWDPEKLIRLYKRAGAKYFVALANHHDNFDTFDSAYQPWNSVNIGPHKDIVGTWAKAARENGLRFGVSVHAARAWVWYEVAQGADKTGPLAGVPYDGKLTKADGVGKWWQGYDPQDLYAQNHVPGKGPIVWDWDPAKGSSVPDAAYCAKFFNRTVDLIDKYHPDLVYFDDDILPLYQVDSRVGLKIAAHYYNSNMQLHDGQLQAVLNTKNVDPQQRKCLVWDIERGRSDTIEPLPWQTDTCIGHWHYDVGVFQRHRYKTAQTVVQTLVDIVSKNGNLLLSIPVKGDGTLDGDEINFLQQMAAWMDVNSECIFGTRPFTVFGEGPAAAIAPTTAKSPGFNESKQRPLGEHDIRFTTRGTTLYAIVMGWPADQKLSIKTLAAQSNVYPGDIQNIRLLGSDAKLTWTRTDAGLTISLPDAKPCDYAYAFKITPAP
ncbi:MAG: alpha-L-fucosidase [Tepidisphaeraceae bacterium]